MSTEILITPPGGQQHKVKAFDTCQTTLSTTDKAGSFSLELPAFDNSLIDAFPVGSDVQINQDDNVFRGWAISPPKTVNGKLKTVSLQGSTYTSRTQKIIVTESYTNTAVSDIVIDLFTKYVPWAKAVSAKNFIQNSDLETGLPTLNDTNITNALSVQLNTTNSRSGVLSMKATTSPTPGTSDRYCQLGATGSMNGLIANIAYEISAWVFVPSGQGISLNSIFIQAYDYVGTLYGKTASNKPTAFDTWQKLTCIFTPQIGSTRAMIRLYISQDIQDKVVYWDDISVEQAGAKVSPCTKALTIRFGDSYLWDVMERLCQIAAYDWYIDHNLDVNFFNGSTRINPTVLSQANRNFKKGTANFTPDASKLVNKLWVKGGKATSDPFTQTITVNGTTPIALFYTTRAPGGESVTVVIGGVTKTVGIQNIDKSGTKDFLLNASEKLLIPDLCTSGTGTITYRYEYPIKILLEDQESRAKYGLFEDVLKVETDDKILAKEQGMQHLARYSNPVTTGSIQPMKGVYRPGELIKIEIPDLKINEYMQIREITCESLAGLGAVNRTLQLSSRERDAVSILKDMNNRLAKLEKTTFNDDDGPVEKYVYFSDSIATPTFVDDGLSWSLHQYHICGQTMCSAGVIM